MNAQLRHKLADNGAITVILRGGDGSSFAASLTPSAAKVAAWAILADLEPDEAALARAAETRAERKRFTYYDRALVAYARGAETLGDVVAETDMSISSAEARTYELRKAGLVEVVFRGGGRKRPSRYALTPAGQERAALLERALV
jgi:DNA-binding transcriptional ArsR family regulator